MKSKSSDIEAITLRRANVADADKVRYRVYSTPTEYIAVIAESALMAVKVSGIRKPHKIVRDLPTEGVAIEAKKMAAIDAAAARIALPVKQLERPEQLNTELKAIDPNLKKTLFKPMNIGDLQSQGKNRPRILPPELVHEIIEQYAKATMLQSAAVQAVPAEAAVPAPLEPQPSPEERIMALANEVVLPAAPPAEGKELSPEEVAKLLNE